MSSQAVKQQSANSLQAFAIWELAHIAEEDAVRRRAIFEDIDRKDGPMWSQVYAICMELLKGIDNRIDDFGRPAAQPTPAPAEPELQSRNSAPLREDVFAAKQSDPATLRGNVRKAIGQITQSPGSSPAKQLSPVAKRKLQDAKDFVFTKEQQELMSPANVRSQFETLARYLVTVPKIGELFYEGFATRFAGVVLGTPFAEPTLYCNATRALCSLAVHSLGEDQYGKVHRDVPSIIRTMTSIIRKVEALKLRFPMHWTDTRGIRDSPDVKFVLDTLRDSLLQVVTAFEPFSTDLRLTLGDLRHAKEATIKPEPEQPVIEKGPERKLEERRRAEPARGSRRPQRAKLDDMQVNPEMEEVRASGRTVRAR